MQTATRSNSVFDLVLCKKPKFVTNVRMGPLIDNSDDAVVIFYLFD